MQSHTTHISTLPSHFRHGTCHSQAQFSNQHTLHPCNWHTQWTTVFLLQMMTIIKTVLSHSKVKKKRKKEVGHSSLRWWHDSSPCKNRKRKHGTTCRQRLPQKVIDPHRIKGQKLASAFCPGWLLSKGIPQNAHVILAGLSRKFCKNSLHFPQKECCWWAKQAGISMLFSPPKGPSPWHTGGPQIA